MRMRSRPSALRTSSAPFPSPFPLQSHRPKTAVAPHVRPALTTLSPCAGCHAGLNSLSCATNWAHANPGKIAISAGVEVCSAGFVWPGEKNTDEMEGAQKAAEQKLRMNHAVVNSLFADGCFAALLFCPPPSCPMPPNYLVLHEFKSLTGTHALDTMVYKWSDEYKQFWFYLSEDAPYAVGGALFAMLHDCQASGIPMESIRHWVRAPPDGSPPAAPSRRHSPPRLSLRAHVYAPRSPCARPRCNLATPLDAAVSPPASRLLR